MTTHTVAETILQQLGGGRFLVMTGSKVAADGNTLRIKVGRGSRVPFLTVTLDPSDTYSVQPYKGRGASLRPAGDPLTDVYCDRLQDVFTELTGFYTRF